MQIKLMATAVALVLVLPIAAYAQSGGAAAAATGAVAGAAVGEPVGAVVGVGGAVAGGIADNSMSKFREYVVREHHPSYHYDREVVIGAELPATGVTYYDVPHEYGVTQYRYTVVNEHPVLVDPRTHKIVQIIG